MKILRNKKAKLAAQSQLQDCLCQANYGIIAEKETKRRDGGTNYHYRFIGYYAQGVRDITLLVAVITGWKLSTVPSTDQRLIVTQAVLNNADMDTLMQAVWGADWRQHYTTGGIVPQITFGIVQSE